MRPLETSLRQNPHPLCLCPITASKVVAAKMVASSVSSVLLAAAALIVAGANAERKSATQGLTLRTYGNTALAGTPSSTSVASSATIALAAAPSSGELSGTLTFPASGTYEFTCNFTGTTTGWVWVDGHQVCNDGNAYKLGAGSFDNPLPMWVAGGVEGG